MKVRKLKATDAESYRDIRLQALKNHPEAFSSSYEEKVNYPISRYESQLNNENAHTFGAFNQNELVGVVTLIFEDKRKLKHRANIAAMYVRPECRKLGAGKKLMSEAINIAKGIDYVEKIYLSVTSTNETAKRLYSTLGFKTYGVDKEALKIGEHYYDEELMVLII